jgi:hypothetical protein
VSSKAAYTRSVYESVSQGIRDLWVTLESLQEDLGTE